jgi:hypothetical protein
MGNNTMSSNIKKIDEAFKLFVENHAVLNQYRGMEYKGSSDNNTYPLLYAAWRISTVKPKSGTLNPIVPIYIYMQKCNDEDLINAYSGAVQIMYDFLITFEDNKREYGFWCEIEPSNTPKPIEGETMDSSLGFTFDIQLHFFAARNQDAIPFK